MKKFSLFFISLFFVFSCEVDNSSNNVSKNQQIQSLEKNGYFSNTVARNLTIIELCENFPEISNEETFEVSLEPDLIYDSNGNIYKYEFTLYHKNGKSLGIAVVSPHKEDYAFLNSVLLGVERNNSLNDGEIFIAGNNYPFEVLKSSQIKPNIKRVQSRSISKEDQFYDDILLFDEDEFSEMEVHSVNEIIEEYKNELLYLEKEKEKYWNKIFSNYSYSELSKREMKIAKKEITPRSISVNYIIPKYNTDSNKYTSWQGPCVPSAMARWYRGVYSKYYSFYIPEKVNFIYSSKGSQWNQLHVKNHILRLSAVSDGGLFYDLCEKGGVFKTKGGLVTGDKYNDMIRYISQKEYTTIYTAVRSTAHKNILEKKQPVFLTSKINGQYHCVLAAGVRKSNNSYYYYILDNGKQNNCLDGVWMRDTNFLVGGFQVRQR